MTVVALLLTCAALQAPLSAPFPCRGDRCLGAWGWPLRPVPRVLRTFEPPARPWAPGHRGVDLSARPGQAVYAAGSGQVSYAARLAGRGVVAITHGSLRTTYLPVRPSVPVGRQVNRGDRIGTVEGRPEHCGGPPCLHWGVRDRLGYTDPLALLGRGPIRLLPVWGSPGPRRVGAGPSSPAADPWGDPESSDRSARERPVREGNGRDRPEPERNGGGPPKPDRMGAGGHGFPAGPAGRPRDHSRGHPPGSDDPPGVRPRPALVAGAATAGGSAVVLLSPALRRPLRRPLRRLLRRRALATVRATTRAVRPRRGGGPGDRSP